MCFVWWKSVVFVNLQEVVSLFWFRGERMAHSQEDKWPILELKSGAQSFFFFLKMGDLKHFV